MRDIEELRYITANPFKRKGKKELEKNRFIFSLSIDLDWFKTDEAKKIMESAIENELLTDKGETVKANFDLNKIELTFNYQPDTEIIHRLKNIQNTDTGETETTQKLKSKGYTEKEIESQTQEIIDKMHGYIDRGAAELILARKKDIDIEKQVEKELRSLFKQQ
ncbi:DUF2240 family protein [Methanonatronarchaeum sp. AMET6-2]|uniref:DUF2240 family protein n=1 Tax=Methanonatronarchaeum sp. AMET6-2 TaxID=2933293 RepID=UPI00122671B7|nr:DUF2240 family protein [Methanonatronarchaeum sp. AMET6-2]RZN63463.1 MAG: DUF2240 family protein [Methanonatronarchaeia archaeon]UOY09757.1 DUF2240 family protein [Methanonatronarchaeum sp. AMET6-2]